MLKPLLALLLLTQITLAQSPVSGDEAKAWMIQHFNIPADAKITYWFVTGNPVKSCAINWQIGSGSKAEFHTRSYDFRTQTVTSQMDL